MEWIKFNDQKPPSGKRVLVIKRYLDAEYGENGYDANKSFWIGPIITIDSYWQGRSWLNGGDVTHWMELPKLPSPEENTNGWMEYYGFI